MNLNIFILCFTTLLISGCATIKPDTTAAQGCSKYSGEPYWDVEFGTWQLKLCKPVETQKIIAEVWDRHFLYAGAENEIKQMSPREVANLLTNPKYRVSSTQLDFPEVTIDILGWAPNRCHDQLEQQKILVIKAGNVPKWQEIKFATFRLVNSEIVLAQLDVDEKTGTLSESRKSGSFTCWIEPPTP